MTAKRRAYHHGDLANALVNVSLELVEANGIEAYSLREAAIRCGVAVSAAYKHFPSKSAILDAVADRGYAALGQRMQDRAEGATRGLRGKHRAEAGLVELGRAYILFATERPHLFRLMYGPHGPQGGGRDPRPDAPAHHLSVLLRDGIGAVLIAYGRDGGDVETHKVIAWALVHGFAMMVVDGVWAQPGRKAMDDMIEALGQAVLRSLRQG